MMVVMLILSIIMAAFAPVMTTRSKVDLSSPWRYSSNNSDIYYGIGDTQSAMIGQRKKKSGDLESRLVVNTSSSVADQNHILFKIGGDGTSSTTLGALRLSDKHSILLGSILPTGLSGTNNVLIGDSLNLSVPAGTQNNVIIGSGARTVGDGVVSVGSESASLGLASISIGSRSETSSSSEKSIVIGSELGLSGKNSIVIGQDTGVNYELTGDNSILLGKGIIQGNETVLIGNNTSSNGNRVVSVGGSSQALSDEAIAIGYQATASNGSSIAIGSPGTYSSSGPTEASGADSIAIGDGTQSTAYYSVAIGPGARAEQEKTVALGYKAKVQSSDSLAIGPNASVQGIYSGRAISIGSGSTSLDEDAIAIGTSSKAAFTDSIAIGSGATALDLDAIAIGTGAEAKSPGGLAFGQGAKANGYYNIALGSGACKYATGWNKVCIGEDSGPKSGSSWASDSQERIFIGGQSNFNNGAAVLEVHNSTTPDGTINYQPLKSTVVVNGTLIVKGGIISSGPVNRDKHGFDEDGGVYIFGDRRQDSQAAVIGLGSGLEAFSDDGLFKSPRNWSTTHYISDRRLKYVGSENKSGLDKIKQLKVFNYTFKKDKEQTPHVGVIAQDLQKVFPAAVSKDEKGFLSIRLEDIFYALVNSVKELDSKLSSLLKHDNEQDLKIKSLEAENQELKSRLEKLEKSLR